MTLRPPIVFVDEEIGLFPTVEDAVRSVDPADVATTEAYDADGRQLVLRVEDGVTVLDVGASGERRPEELRAQLAAIAQRQGTEDLGLAGRDPTTVPLADLIAAFTRDASLPPRPSALVWLVGLLVLALGVAVAVLLW